MAIIENIKIEGDSSGVTEAIDQLNKRVDELEEKLGSAKGGVNDLGKSGKKNASIISKAFGGLKKVITAPFDVAKKAASGLGSLLKGGLGFGLITAAVDKASEAFNTNQGVVDSLNKVLGTVSIIFNQIATAIGEVFEEQSALNGGFDATKKVLGGLISGVLNVFVGIIQGIKLAVQTAQLAWEESFFGDGDVTRIKELNEGIAETKEALKQTGEALLESGKMVVNNLAEAAQEVSNTVVAVATRVQDEIKNLDVSKAVAQAERLVELQKAAELADVRRQEIQLKFQNTQEQLRQLRDDEMKSIEERQAANSQLFSSLEKQAELEREQIQIKVAAAQAEYNITKTNENLIKLKQSQLELTDLDERLQGQRSEALANQNSLLREQLDIQRSQAETAQEIYQIQEEASLELLHNEVARAEKEIEIAQNVFNKKKEFLEAQVALYAEGTQARADAENELAVLEAENASRRLVLEKTLQDAKVATIQQALASVASLVGEQTAAGKALALAQVAIDTYTGATKALAQGGVYGYIGAAGIIASGLANARSIMAVETPDGGGVTAPTIVNNLQVPSQAAQFNLVGQSGINQLAESIGQQNKQPMRAYVVGGDITSSQELERKRVKTATFG